ncbi:hypothetical protein [Gilliamella sp. ESL0250]|nr:hypothetical protein [Gilliamella sp. ESL0250]
MTDLANHFTVSCPTIYRTEGPNETLNSTIPIEYKTREQIASFYR